MVSIQENPPRRCAVYTRKSTNPTLDHEITSIEAQREICSTYVASQRHKDWVLLSKRYDDPAQSGVNFDRPALSELMRDIEAGQVDVVVIYKIDRLTRSLYDFVRLLEVFDRYDIAFVSISQAFDTSDSMGRMILNVLLTFSQFERELIADRIRDNIETRKRHGMWHGGMPPLGYNLVRKRLVVLESEAEIVRFLFRRFLELGNTTALSREVAEAGLCSQRKVLKSGRSHGGGLLSHAQIYAVLGNPVYVGEIRGRDRTYPGEQQPLVAREVWDAVQKLRESRRRGAAATSASQHFLNGLLRDSFGRQMRLNVERYKCGSACKKDPVMGVIGV